MSAFWQALLIASRHVVPAGPLRALAYDDQDFTFFTYAGTWYYYQGTGWPGGAANNTVTYRGAVVPTEPTPTADTKIILFMGTPEEGIDFLGSSEDDGKMDFFIRALDSRTNSGWVQFGAGIGSYCYLYQWQTTGRQDDNLGNTLNYYVTYQGQNLYSHLATPGLIQLRGLPAGRYQFREQKTANTTDPNANGNRATYRDGAIVYTRHPTFL